MRNVLIAFCLLVSVFCLNSLPVSAQSRDPRFQCSNCDEEPQDMTHRQEYEALKAKFYQGARQVVHEMITGPATRTTIDLKESLRKVCDLEQDYLRAQYTGEQFSARAFAARYIELLGQVSDLHDDLNYKCRKVKRFLADTDQAWLMMREEYPDYYAGDRLDIEERAAQVSDALAPLSLGEPRITEVDQEVLKSVQEQLKKNPNQQIDLQEEYLKAAELILERHLNNPPSSSCP